MMSSKTDKTGAKITSRGNQALSVDAVRLLKTQDAGYIRTMAQKTKKAIERVEQTIVLGNDHRHSRPLGSSDKSSKSSKSSHITFVDSIEEQQNWVDTELEDSEEKVTTELYGQRVESDISDEEENTRKSKGSTHSKDDVRNARIVRKKRKREQEKKETILKILKKRENDLRSVEIELDVQRGKMNNSNGFGMTRTGVKFKNKARKR
jgi:hypothetical protein